MAGSKVYVDVIAYFGTEGQLIPLSIIWENGREYMIDRVLDYMPGYSLKRGSDGDRYTVQVRGKTSHLFLERGEKIGFNSIGRWYVQALFR